MLLGRKAFVFGLLFLASAFSSPVSMCAQDQKKQDKPKRAEEKDRQKREKAQQDELRFQYEQWLKEVSIIITPEELAAFRNLSTNEERERAIEIFWGMRDPTPDTAENEFKDEHYRRIAYANERFASGIPGWRTDRGRIYILHGPPDEIEFHAGGSYIRPHEEGGGQTAVHPFEKWRYRHLEDVGNDVVLEFVDQTNSGEFKLEMDPSKKDALLYVPGAGLTTCESLGLCSKTQRFTRSDGTNLGAPMGGEMLSNSAFERMDRHFKAQRPPTLRFKDLETHVTSRLVRNQLEFAHRADFIRVTGDTVLVPITVQIPNREMTFLNKNGVHVATVNLFARITTVTGNRVQVFEDTITRDIPESLLAQALRGNSIYQKAVPLRAGLYKLDLVLKDVNSGDVGVLQERLAVPLFDEDKLATSSLILADLIEPVPSGQLGQGPFVLGARKVRPRLDATFSSEERLGVFLQVYNLAADPITHKPSATVEYRVLKGAQEIVQKTQHPEDLRPSGEQLTLEQMLPLNLMSPGRYELEVRITDNVAKRSAVLSAPFNLKAVEKAGLR